MPARFFVFEGIDGSGKSTQARMLEDQLRKRGLKVMFLREPGGTPIGEWIRDGLLDARHPEMSPWTELFLFTASRAQILHEKIRPALARGEIVVLDRYYFSTAAYQGAAGGVGVDAVLHLSEKVAGFDKPDLVFLADLDPALARQRLKPAGDRMENKGLEYQKRVREGYLSMAHRDPSFRVLDASRPAEEVRRRIIEEVERVL